MSAPLTMPSALKMTMRSTTLMTSATGATHVGDLVADEQRSGDHDQSDLQGEIEGPEIEAIRDDSQGVAEPRLRVDEAGAPITEEAHAQTRAERRQEVPPRPRQ